MSLHFGFAIVIGLICLIGGLARAARNVEAAQHRVAKLVGHKETQVDRIKRVARQTLQMRRDLRAQRHRLDMVELDCGSLEERIRHASSVDRRLYVLDDRRTPNDQTFIAVVSHGDYAHQINARARPDVVRAWYHGRRFVVWALDKPKARNKVFTRFPERSGYHLRSLLSEDEHHDKGNPAARPPDATSGQTRSVQNT